MNNNQHSDCSGIYTGKGWAQKFSKTMAYKIQMPECHPEESTQHSEQDKSLKSNFLFMLLYSGYTNNDNYPISMSPSDGSESSGTTTVFSGAFTAKDFNAVKRRDQQKPQH
jgi:hypothetical protein